jgi:UrcA family protein
MRNLPALLVFAVIAACPVAATHAGSNDSRRSETVQFGDLDLNNQQGAITLFRRLHNAAADVCTEPADGAEFATVVAYKRCVDHAMSDAVSAVDQPGLTTYAQRHGVSTMTTQTAFRN